MSAPEALGTLKQYPKHSGDYCIKNTLNFMNYWVGSKDVDYLKTLVNMHVKFLGRHKKIETTILSAVKQEQRKEG